MSDEPRRLSDTATARALFASVVDYAGLFPPAKLPMDAAVRAYAEARAGRHAWMLGRFVLAATRIDEFVEAAAPLLEGEAWPVSLLIGDAGTAERASARVRETCAERVRVASFEVAPSDAAAIAASARALRAAALPPEAEIYFEVPAGVQSTERLEAVAQAGARAKLRTGGITAEVFPAIADVREFLLACARRRLPFKATAGLHHACRAAYRLTYEPDSPSGVMHGFVNLSAAAALAWHGAGAEELDALLGDPRPTAWLRRDALEWRARRLDAAALGESRRSFFRSFGSCSFDEPSSELEAAPLG